MHSVKKGDLITCTNGHVVGEVLRDLYPGDMIGTWGAAFGNWRQADVPVVGSQEKPRCAVCGADFIDPTPGSWVLHIAGWRP